MEPHSRRAPLGDPVIGGLAAGRGRPPAPARAQIVLCRHLRLGSIVLPGPAAPARVREDFAVFSFTLTAEEMRAPAGLDRGLRAPAPRPR
ncbi:hypothetical protein ABZ800_32375 [Streptomyces sp. NPDC047813]|uniref:hypothetical protein n=1 Tax=Streptomyces sp. NPDC047813 TaxID=3154608 RepID=UPI0033DCDBE5